MLILYAVVDVFVRKRENFRLKECHSRRVFHHKALCESGKLHRFCLAEVFVALHIGEYVEFLKLKRNCLIIFYETQQYS